MNKENLTLSNQLSSYRGSDLLLGVAANKSEDRMPLLRRSGKRGHLPDAGNGHLQGSRNRSSTHRQDINVGLQLLKLLLVLNTKALLFIDDHKP